MIYQNNKLLAVSLASNSGLSKYIYSTEEQVIGWWIDGRPLYRKVVPFISGSSEGQHQVSDVVIPSVASVVRFSAVLHHENNLHTSFSNGYYAQNDGYRFNLFVYNGILFDNISGAQFINMHGNAVLEYIKTTDEATIQLSQTLQSTFDLTTDELQFSPVSATASNADVEVTFDKNS